MFQADAEPVHRLTGGVGLRVPNGAQRVSNVDLADFGDRHLAQLREYMEFQRGHPPTGLPIALEVRLPAVEGIQRNLVLAVQVLDGLAALELLSLDGINALPNRGPPVVGVISGLLKRDAGLTAKTHLRAASMNRHSEEPLALALSPLVQPWATAVCILPRRHSFELEGSQTPKSVSHVST